jgi:hypothetical protein
VRGTSGEYLIFTWHIPDSNEQSMFDYEYSWLGLPLPGIFTTINVNRDNFSYKGH